MVASDYQHIWDCCCDHGFLGASLIADKISPQVHLVDIVPELISSLEIKLNKLFPHQPTDSSKRWQTHCLDSSNLPLEDYHGKQLIIIAGVGGELATSMVRDICLKHPDVALDFLLCPVHQLYTLRQQLIKLKIGLKSEVLIKENKRFYEILLLSRASEPEPELKTKEVSPTGKAIWQGNSVEEKKIAQDYLQVTLSHYQRMQLGSDNPALVEAFNAYQGISIEPS